MCDKCEPAEITRCPHTPFYEELVDYYKCDFHMPCCVADKNNKAVCYCNCKDSIMDGLDCCNSDDSIDRNKNTAQSFRNRSMEVFQSMQPPDNCNDIFGFCIYLISLVMALMLYTFYLVFKFWMIYFEFMLTVFNDYSSNKFFIAGCGFVITCMFYHIIIAKIFY